MSTDQQTSYPYGQADRLNELVSSARSLLAKMEEVHNSKEFQGVWSLHAIRGGQYSGPTYNVELERLAKAIKDLGW